MATENIATGKKYRILVDAVNDIWDRISFWTKASDVEFNDGSNLEDAKSSFGKGMLQRNTVYHEGDIAYTNSAPSWVQLKCIVTGTTAVVEPTASYASIDTQGMSVIDGTATFEVCDVRLATSLSNSLNQPASVGLVNQHVSRLDAKMGDLNWYISHGWLPKIPDTEVPANLEDCTWKEISDLAGADLLKDYFAIGDSKKIRFPTGEIVEMQIADFNHDDHRGTVDFISKNCLRQASSYSSARWDDSTIKKYLDQTIWGYLPDGLKEVIIPKDTVITESDSWIQTNESPTLWLPGAFEVSGATWSYLHSEEQKTHTRYPIFAKYGAVKKVEFDYNSPTNWLTLSRSTNRNNGWHEWIIIDGNGSMNRQDNNYTSNYYFPLCFRLGYYPNSSEHGN